VHGASTSRGHRAPASRGSVATAGGTGDEARLGGRIEHLRRQRKTAGQDFAGGGSPMRRCDVEARCSSSVAALGGVGKAPVNGGRFQVILQHEDEEEELRL
jgi:hypothetical protein